MKDIVGYEGRYAITSCGKVWSYKSQKFLKPIEENGYYRVNLYDSNGKLKRFFIHRLVGEAYIPNPLGLPHINHKDEVRTHNWVNNLEWCDPQYNNTYGKHIENAAKNHRKPVYCVELDKTFESGRAVAEWLGVEPSSVSKCCVGKIKTLKGYHFQFREVLQSGET